MLPKKKKGNPEPQSLTQDSQDVAFLRRTAVKSQSSLQTGAEHEIAIWREGQSSDHSAVLPERRQKTRKRGGEQTSKTPENSSNVKNSGEQNNQGQAEDPTVLTPAGAQDNRHTNFLEH